MAKLIETTPSAPYFGELWNTPNPSLHDVTALALPLPDDYRPYEGNALPSAANGTLVPPVLLPLAPNETRDCLWTCLTGLPAVALGGAAMVSTASGYIPKSWVGMRRGFGDASRFTTPTSIIAHRYPSLDRTIGPPWSEHAPGGSLLRPRWTNTTSLLRFVGRWIPGIGWALLAIDIEVIDQCYANCRGKRSYLRAACEELTPFCAKPAY